MNLVFLLHVKNATGDTISRDLCLFCGPVPVSLVSGDLKGSIPTWREVCGYVLSCGALKGKKSAPKPLVPHAFQSYFIAIYIYTCACKHVHIHICTYMLYIYACVLF